MLGTILSERREELILSFWHFCFIHNSFLTRSVREPMIVLPDLQENEHSIKGKSIN